uniref:Atypical/PIKK/PI4K protein kinase n=1 Tax=Mycena chlorophos TaxID=658473 RepID=A0ABQ0LJC3_MYCCL|nr:atypical/PIKK/PI4K protein kinase [Mycena chlorophos]
MAYGTVRHIRQIQAVRLHTDPTPAEYQSNSALNRLFFGSDPYYGCHRSQYGGTATMPSQSYGPTSNPSRIAGSITLKRGAKRATAGFSTSVALHGRGKRGKVDENNLPNTGIWYAIYPPGVLYPGSSGRVVGADETGVGYVGVRGRSQGWRPEDLAEDDELGMRSFRVLRCLFSCCRLCVARFIFETAKISQLFCHQIIWNMKANCYKDDAAEIEDPMKPALDKMTDQVVSSLSGDARAFYDREFGFFNKVTSISGKLKPYIKKTKPEKKVLLRLTRLGVFLMCHVKLRRQ